MNYSVRPSLISTMQGCQLHALSTTIYQKPSSDLSNCYLRLFSATFWSDGTQLLYFSSDYILMDPKQDMEPVWHFSSLTVLSCSLPLTIRILSVELYAVFLITICEAIIFGFISYPSILLALKASSMF